MQALLYKKLSANKVRCAVCEHRCVIIPNQRGICGVRENQNGQLVSLVYGKAIAEHVDPIEKKPLFHFLPGSQTLSVATMGCNFHCQHCQNADISQLTDRVIVGKKLSPEQIVADALANHCPSIAYTYTEPTIFLEYALDTMKLARQKGLKNVWVSNGYFTEQTFNLIKKYLDAINIDLKFFDDKLYQKICGGRLSPVLDNLQRIKQNKIWLEVTTLVIPGLTDQDKQLEKTAQFIKDKLGADTPWHLSRFFPAYQLADYPPTQEETICQVVKIGKQAGLKYVYAGNIASDTLENTYCPKCGELVIKRTGYRVLRKDDESKCKKCGYRMEIVI